MGLVDISATPTNTTIIPTTPAFTGSLAFTSGTAFPILTAVVTGSDGRIYPIDPTTTIVGQIPLMDGVALTEATAAGESIQVAIVFGGVFQTTGTNWAQGGLLYIAADGALTQDYLSLSTTVRWIICVGRAVTPTSFIYEPHLPTNYVQDF